MKKRNRKSYADEYEFINFVLTNAKEKRDKKSSSIIELKLCELFSPSHVVNHAIEY